MFSITKHQGNANQNRNELSPHTCQDDFYYTEITNVVKVVKKGKYVYTLGRNTNYYGKGYKVPSKKWKIEIPCDKKNSTSGYISKVNKTTSQRDMVHWSISRNSQDMDTSKCLSRDDYVK